MYKLSTPVDKSVDNMFITFFYGYNYIMSSIEITKFT